MSSLKMRCGKPFEITIADSYNGPEQDKGQNSNNNATWYRVEGDKWRRSYMAKHHVKVKLENMTWAQLSKCFSE